MRMYMVNARQDKNLSQAEVARLCNITRQYYGQLELGQKGVKLPLQTASNLAKVLGIPLERFLEDETLMHSPQNCFHAGK